MLLNYLTVALRNIIRYKYFSIINVAGLSVGISSATIIFMLCLFELSTDTFHNGSERIYRVVSHFNYSGMTLYRSMVSSSNGIDILEKTIKEEIAGVESAVSFNLLAKKFDIQIEGLNNRVSVSNQKIAFVSSEFFHLFKFNWIAGNSHQIFLNPNEAIITKEIAQRLLPSSSISALIGRQIILNDSIPIKIKGIIENPVDNTVFNFPVFISSSIQNTFYTNNFNSESYLFVKLFRGVSAGYSAKQINHFFKKRDAGPANLESKYELQPVSDIYFNSVYDAFGNAQGHKPTLYSLIGISVFLLALGCINFINLTTAMSSLRTKEIGIRKTLGSSNNQLVIQFLAETFILTSAASLLSLIWVELLFRLFSDNMPSGLNFNYIINPSVVLFIILLNICVTFFAGFYPALILSKHKPAQIIRMKYFKPFHSPVKWLRKGLIVFQFSIAMIFIVGALLVNKQINFTFSKNVGFNKESVIYFKIDDERSYSRSIVLRDMLERLPGVSMVSLSNDPPFASGSWTAAMKYFNGLNEKELLVHLKIADSNYIKLYGLTLLAGKNISESDTIKQYIINRTLAGILGFSNPNDAVGKYLDGIPITGVIEDFNQQSLHQPITPLAITSWNIQHNTFNILLHKQNGWINKKDETITEIGKAYKEVYPERDFNFSFLDDTIKNFYQKEQTIADLLYFATGLSVFISLIGLLGLVTFTSVQRKKEIGIRKVLGATISQVVFLLSVDFVKPLMIAFVITVPVTWFFVEGWLQNFAYRISVTLWPFILGWAIITVLTLSVISFQTIKAAIDNPANSLKYE